MRLSQHAADRMRQRAILLDVVEMIGAYGQPRHSSGAIKFSMDRETLDLVRDDLGRQAAESLARFQGVILVEIEGVLVTVARRTRRLRHGASRTASR